VVSRRRRQQATGEGEDIFELIASLPQFDPHETRPPEENRNGSWAGRLLVLEALGINTCAARRFELEREWEKRRQLLVEAGDLAAESRRRIGARRGKHLGTAAAHMARRGGTRDGSRPLALPEHVGAWRLQWETAVDTYLTENEGGLRRLREQLWASDRLDRALRGIRVVGASNLVDLVVELSSRGGRDEARRRGHACRLCGDVGCAVHCAPSPTGKHHARRHEGATTCSRCGQRAEKTSLGFGRWRPTSGDPATWFDDTPLSPEELFFARMDDLAAGRAEEA
jgi:hypothetical protein